MNKLQLLINQAIAKNPSYYQTPTRMEILVGDVEEKKQNKYHVAAYADRTYKGIVFDSKKEMEFYIFYESEEKQKRISLLQTQYPFLLLSGGVHEKTGITYNPIYYYADFFFVDRHGEQWIVDAKGLKTDVYIMKKKLLLSKYPRINFKEV